MMNLFMVSVLKSKSGKKLNGIELVKKFLNLIFSMGNLNHLTLNREF